MTHDAVPAVECGASSHGDNHRYVTDHVACVDNLALLRTLPDACCDLIYIDPPFGITECLHGSDPPAGGRGTAACDAQRAFVEFLRPRCVEMRRVLAETGSFYLHCDWRSVHYVKVMLDEVFGARNFLNEIIWSYRSGGRPSAWFMRKHDTLLLYADSAGRHTFNALRGGAYRTQGLKIAADGTPYKPTRNGPIRFSPEGPLISDVWDIPIISTVSKKRSGYPYQKPDALLERIVRASSNEGDLVADFFCGSGTTLVAAKRLHRNWLGCDGNPEAVAIAQRRLAAVERETTGLTVDGRSPSGV